MSTTANVEPLHCGPEPSLNHPKHLKYWLRNLKTLLPTAYTSTDLSRLSLAFFSLSALDLLGKLEACTTLQERTDWADWIYLCQLPTGGFRGSPATTGAGETWDVANLPACYFALASLAVLKDDMKRVDWVGLAEFLTEVQREDGGFGEWVLKGGVAGGEWKGGKGGKGGESEAKWGADLVMGGEDMRFMYCAMAVRWIMRGGARGRRNLQGVKDVDVDRCESFIRDSATYDSGFAAFPFTEAHAGHAYCALSSLSLLGCLAGSLPHHSLSNTLRWLVSMQIPYISGNKSDDMDKEQTAELPSRDGAQPLSQLKTPLDQPQTQSYIPMRLREHTSPTPPDALGVATSHPSIPPPHHPRYDHDNITGGFCGRINKSGDTCYSFWVGGALDVLGFAELMHLSANRKFLLEHTQHVVGGFGKLPGPGCLPGLAALSIINEPGLKKIDSALCISVDAKEHIMRMPWFSEEIIRPELDLVS